MNDDHIIRFISDVISETGDLNPYLEKIPQNMWFSDMEDSPPLERLRVAHAKLDAAKAARDIPAIRAAYEEIEAAMADLETFHRDRDFQSDAEQQDWAVDDWYERGNSPADAAAWDEDLGDLSDDVDELWKL